LPQLVVQDLELVPDLYLGPAADLPANPPAVTAGPRRHHTSPSPIAWPMEPRI